MKLSGFSYDYWGRNDDSKEIIVSPAYQHGLRGQLKIMVIRIVDMFMDFEYSNEFDSAEIISGDFEETDYRSCYADEEDDDVLDAYNTCPDCGKKINLENDGGNGFCATCAPNH